MQGISAHPKHKHFNSTKLVLGCEYSRLSCQSYHHYDSSPSGYVVGNIVALGLTNVLQLLCHCASPELFWSSPSPFTLKVPLHGHSGGVLSLSSSSGYDQSTSFMLSWLLHPLVLPIVPHL